MIFHYDGRISELKDLSGHIVPYMSVQESKQSGIKFLKDFASF